MGSMLVCSRHGTHCLDQVIVMLLNMEGNTTQRFAA